ncbi:tail fiber protein [Edwardsiella piscicida]|nr:tail fiber protein [Edwardsiella piscicida]
MAKNDFKSFATAENANVTSQADWEALPALLSGFTVGKASSAQVNKALRQASFIAAALAQYTANKSGQDVLDDGDIAGFIAKMAAAFGKDYQALDATLTTLSGLATGANKLPYFTGTDTAGQTDLTQVGRDIIGKATVAAVLEYLGLRANNMLPEASLSTKGIVQLNDSITHNNTTAATPSLVKRVYDEATRRASTSQAGQVRLNDSTNSTSSSEAATANALKRVYNDAIRPGTTSQPGQVQLEDSTSSSSTARAATANAVRRVSDKVNKAAVGERTLLFSGNVGNGNISLSQNPSNFDEIIIISTDDGNNHAAIDIKPMWAIEAITSTNLSSSISIRSMEGSHWSVSTSSFKSTLWSISSESSRIHRIYGVKYK